MKKTWLVALLFLAAVIGVVGVVLTSNPSPSSAAHRSTGVPPVMESPRQAGRLPYNPATSEAAQLAPFLSAPISLRDGGAKRPFELATDELYVRQADGNNRVVKISKTDSPEVFAAAIEKARAEHGTEPELVLYPAGAPRNEYTRRIVTRQVVLNAPSRAEADAIAAAQGLVFQKAPVFAPNAFVYEAPTSAEALGVQTKQDSPIVATTLLARKAATLSSPNDPYYKLQWHLKFQNQPLAVTGTDINVESVWNYPENDPKKYNRGQNVTIGIVDDGFEWAHPDLAPNTNKELQYDWNGKDNDPKPFFYLDAHGTSVGGVAAARGNNRIGVSGVAPEAGLAGMRLIASEFTDLDEAEAMLWKAVEIPEADQIHVKNNSWHNPLQSGGFWFPTPGIGPLSEAALKYAATFGRNGKGTILTFAAGNSFADGSSPDYKAEQNSIYTIAVGAVGSDQLKSDYSEEGACIVVSAPSSSATGSGVMTTDNRGRYGYNEGFSGVDIWGVPDIAGTGDGTKNFGGTSSATPVVSGVVALMLHENPDLGWRDVQEILMRSATKIDLADTDWKTPIAPDNINHSHKYGAGLVNAAEAVRIASTWNNLAPQKSQKSTSNSTDAIDANATVTRTFTLNGDELRVEHVTLKISVKDIPKGNLTVRLKSPSDTISTFCLPHGDSTNELDEWTFMTVRNWGEMSNGDWTLSITNHGAASGTLADAELVVYGTDPDAPVNPPVVNLATSKTSVFVGSNFTLTATAKDKNNNSVQKFEVYEDGVSRGNSTSGIWQLQADAAGTFTFTVNATDGDEVVAASNAVEVEVLAPIAVWDFDNPTYNPVPLATAVQGAKRYAANFGTGNMTFNGDCTASNLWSHKAGEIWVGDGTDTNAVGEMNKQSLNNKALMLRGGKNKGANGKYVVFEFSTADLQNLNVSYASYEDGGGFLTQNWTYSTDGTNWYPVGIMNPTGTYQRLDLGALTALADTTTAFLKVAFEGATSAQGVNFIDNIIISADRITARTNTANFTWSNPATARLGGTLSESPDQSQGGNHSNNSNPTFTETSENLDWVIESADGHKMTVHAEVVDGSKFLSAPGSLLSANNDGMVSGLAEPIPQTTRYELPITSAEPNPAPMRLKLYDAKSKGILILEEKVPFTPGATIGTPTTPKRYRVAYQEAEQVVTVSPGWSNFTTVVDPDPATLTGVFAGYDFSEGDRLIGPDIEASVVDGKWIPLGVKLGPQATYSLLRQKQTASQIVLRGKSVEKSESSQPIKPVELPIVKTSANSSTSGHSHSPAPAASSGGGSQSFTKSANSSKGSKKAKSSSSSKKKTGKKTKAKTS